MSGYNLTLLIDGSVLRMQSSDNFCIAKKVAGAFTTVFMDGAIKPKRADQKVLITRNDFKWEDKFQVFAAVDYKHGMLVRSATNNQKLLFGQQTSYENNLFTDASPAPTSDFENDSGERSPQDSFLAKNIPNNLHVAVMCMAGGRWTPIYVDPDNHSSVMNHQLTPLNEYMLFWSTSVQTESMIDQSKFSRPFTFSFTGGAKSMTVRFGYKSVDKPEAQEQPDFYKM